MSEFAGKRKIYMSKYQLGLYEKAMPGSLSWVEKLQAAKEAGFDYVENSNSISFEIRVI